MVSDSHCYAYATVVTWHITLSNLGTLLDLDLLVRALLSSLSVPSPPLVQIALSVVASIIERVGFPSCAAVRSLVLRILNSSNIEEKIRWQTLKRINDALSVSSVINEHFEKFSSSLNALLKSGAHIVMHSIFFKNFPNYIAFQPTELADLVVSILKTSASLIKIPIFVDLQKQGTTE